MKKHLSFIFIVLLLPFLTQAENLNSNTSLSNNISQGDGPIESRKLKIEWTGNLNGQALGRSWGVNYNPWSKDADSIYLYHTLDGMWEPAPNRQWGIELSAKQNLVKGVESDFGFEIERNWAVYDPQVWWLERRVLDGRWGSLNIQTSLFPAWTHYSYQQEALFSAAWDFTWFVPLPASAQRWGLQLNHRIKPTFYKNSFAPTERSFETRETLFLQWGHFLSYSLSANWQLTHTTVFDLNYFTQAQKAWNRGSAVDDRSTLQLNYFFPSQMGRVGVYFRHLIFEPSWRSSSVGMDLTLKWAKH